MPDMKLPPDDAEGHRTKMVEARSLEMAELRAPRLHPINKLQPPRNAQYLFWSPGNQHASNVHAQRSHYCVDEITDKWPTGRFQFPEAPYTHYMPLPSEPAFY